MVVGSLNNVVSDWYCKKTNTELFGRGIFEWADAVIKFKKR